MNKQLLPSASDQKFEDMTVMVSDSLITDMVADITTLRARLTEVEGERDELSLTFDLQWAAYQRAIQLWREKTGEELVLPDRADLCLWLFAELTQARADLAEVTEKARKYRVALFKTGCNDIFCVEFERDCGKCQTIAREVVKE